MTGRRRDVVPAARSGRATYVIDRQQPATAQRRARLLAG